MRNSSRYLIDEDPLTVQPTLAARIGLNRAVFLQQLKYWLNKDSAHERDGKRWIYNTYEEWHKQFPFWSVEAIRKIVTQLREKGLIETTSKYNKRRADKTLWYTINYEAVDALFEGAPDKSTETLNPPDKSTEPPDKSTDVAPDKSTERYQRLPENNYRDSDLQSGDRPDRDGPPTEKVKAKSIKQYAVAELMQRVNASRAAGNKPHPLPDRSRGQYGEFFSQASKDGREVDTLLLALDYLVAKASGTIEGEPKAWAGFGTALDRIDEGWRPSKVALTDDEREKVEVENEENKRLIEELLSA